MADGGVASVGVASNGVAGVGVAGIGVADGGLDEGCVADGDVTDGGVAACASAYTECTARSALFRAQLGPAAAWAYFRRVALAAAILADPFRFGM